MNLWGHSYTKLPQTSNLFKKHHLNHIHIYLLVFLSSVIFLFPIPPPVLGIKPRTSYILGKSLITRLHAQLQRCGFNIWFCELFLLKTRWEFSCMFFHANIFVSETKFIAKTTLPPIELSYSCWQIVSCVRICHWTFCSVVQWLV